jgi:hypothetical protein
MARAFEQVGQLPGPEAEAVERVYGAIEPVDFSRDVLARHTAKIGVMRVPPVGWTDLGQPARVHNFLSAHGSSIAALGAAS